MDILFIHQNFPGQFKHLAPALAKQGHRVVALTLRVDKQVKWQGVNILPYKIKRGPGSGLHPWLVDFETKLLRAESCYLAARDLKEKGFSPDVIVAHPGWGESMFLRDVWPEARIGLYFELFYGIQGSDNGFDPEFPAPNKDAESLRLRLKNINNMMHLDVGDLALSPTQYQASTFPDTFRERISVIHDGIDTAAVAPDADVVFPVSETLSVSRSDEVITFVNRNLEPYRGYHVFMRALPRLLKERPHARVLIVGGDEVSYGAQPPKGRTWKQIYIDEVRGKISTPDWDRVHFLGKIPYDKFLKLLQVSRAHVYLTYPFVLSWSLIEAMSIATPIVASNTDPVAEVIKDGETGLLFDFFDGDGMIESVCRLLDDHDLAAALGANARALAKSRYDLQSVCLPAQLEWLNRLASMTPGKLTF